MKKLSTILGSTLGVLLAFSVISYAQQFIPQDPPPVKQEPVLEVAGQIPEDDGAPSDAVTTAAPAEKAAEAPAVSPAVLYSATAYSLRGRTASGQYVTRGLIAADPRHLPLGTRVRIEAGPWSGEYLVADTGGAIKGRKIDIWTPSTREALQFGRRPVKITVLSLPQRRGKGTSARSKVTTPAPVVAESTVKQQD